MNNSVIMTVSYLDLAGLTIREFKDIVILCERIE